MSTQVLSLEIDALMCHCQGNENKATLLHVLLHGFKIFITVYEASIEVCTVIYSGSSPSYHNYLYYPPRPERPHIVESNKTSQKRPTPSNSPAPPRNNHKRVCLSVGGAFQKKKGPKSKSL